MRSAYSAHPTYNTLDSWSSLTSFRIKVALLRGCSAILLDCLKIIIKTISMKVKTMYFGVIIPTAVAATMAGWQYQDFG